jgi:hypothetical protein
MHVVCSYEKFEGAPSLRSKGGVFDFRPVRSAGDSPTGNLRRIVARGGIDKKLRMPKSGRYGAIGSLWVFRSMIGGVTVLLKGDTIETSRDEFLI